MSALYMSMSANESDLVIEDELAKGAFLIRKRRLTVGMILTALQHKRFCGI
jgi:hypothetical protein